MTDPIDFEAALDCPVDHDPIETAYDRIKEVLDRGRCPECRTQCGHLTAALDDHVHGDRIHITFCTSCAACPWSYSLRTSTTLQRTGH